MFEVTSQNIGQHVRNVLSENELQPEEVVKDYFATAADAKQYKTKHYTLEMVLAVGYRVRSPRGTQFRRWATNFWSGSATSERRFYRKITDIYATSVDYDPQAEITRAFFATVQNKLEWAITGRTAAELIKDRVDANKPNMGLRTWNNAPDGRIRKADVTNVGVGLRQPSRRATSTASLRISRNALRRLTTTPERSDAHASPPVQRRWASSCAGRRVMGPGDEHRLWVFTGLGFVGLYLVYTALRWLLGFGIDA